MVAWRVTNRPSEGRSGPISYSQVPDLERALISYHAPALLTPAAGGRFFGEGVHDHEAAQRLRSGLDRAPSTGIDRGRITAPGGVEAPSRGTRYSTAR